MRTFELWYTSSQAPHGYAIVRAENAGIAINSLKHMGLVTECREIPTPASLMPISTLVRIADVLNAQFPGRPLFVCNVWRKEPNTLAIVSAKNWTVFDLFQSADARSLYYAIRQQLRRLNHEVSQ